MRDKPRGKPWTTVAVRNCLEMHEADVAKPPQNEYKSVVLC